NEGSKTRAKASGAIPMPLSAAVAAQAAARLRTSSLFGAKPIAGALCMTTHRPCGRMRAIWPADDSKRRIESDHSTEGEDHVKGTTRQQGSEETEEGALAGAAAVVNRRARGARRRARPVQEEVGLPWRGRHPTPTTSPSRRTA